MSKSTWKDILTRSGFNGLDFSLDDYAGHPSSTVLVGSALDTNPLPSQLASPQARGLTVVRSNPTLRYVDVWVQANRLIDIPEYVDSNRFRLQ